MYPIKRKELSIYKLFNFIAGLIYKIDNKILITMESILFGRSKMTSPKRIIILRTGNLGDTLCALPALRKVRCDFDKSEIILMTAVNPVSLNSPEEILKTCGLCDRLVLYKPAELKKARKIILLLRQIRGLRIDILFYLGQSDASIIRLLRDMLFFYLSGCKKVYGFKINKHHIFRLSQRYQRNFDKEAERLLKIASLSGISKKEVAIGLQINQTEREKIDYLLSMSSRNNGNRLVAISPGTNISIKLWPLPNFIELASELIKGYSIFVVLLGDRKDVILCNAIEEKLKNQCLNLAGKTSVQEAAEILRRCDFLITSDSGAGHLAASVGTAVIGIYTARDYPNCWYPWGDNNIIIRHDVPCQICLKKDCKTTECIKGISVEEILAACQKMLR